MTQWPPAPARRFRNKWGNPSEDPWRGTHRCRRCNTTKMLGERLGQSSLGGLWRIPRCQRCYRNHVTVRCFRVSFFFDMYDGKQSPPAWFESSAVLNCLCFEGCSWANQTATSTTSSKTTTIILISTPKLSTQHLGVASRKPMKYSFNWVEKKQNCRTWRWLGSCLNTATVTVYGEG